MYQDIINEVVSRWVERYAASSMFYDKIETPGYTLVEIDQLEQYLGGKIHPTFRALLQRVKLDTTEFLQAAFGSAKEQMLYLHQVNAEGVLVSADPRFIQVGSTGGYLFLLENETGKIFVLDYNNPDYLEQVADDIEQFVCTLATVADQEWPEEEQEALRSVEQFLSKNGVERAYLFWRDLVLGWA